MKKKLCLILLMSLLILGTASIAHAGIFINFDLPTFAFDTIAGDNSHTYNTTYGTITFNGRIDNAFSHVIYPDHTTGTADFLKNSGGPSGKDKITMNFSFDVTQFDLWLLGTSGTVFHGQAYDINGNPIDSEATWTGNGQWFHETASPFTTPVRSIALWSDAGTGNNLAIDDITISPVPEPATLSLLGLGLLGLLGYKKKLG